MEDNVKTGRVKTDLEAFLEANSSTTVAGTFEFMSTSTASVLDLPYGYYAIMPDGKDNTHNPVFLPSDRSYSDNIPQRIKTRNGSKK